VGSVEKGAEMENMQAGNLAEASLSCVSEIASERRWYAAYTRANHEKGVSGQLQLRSIESFLPLYEKVSRWKDRRVRLELPLFSGYVFVRMALEEKLRVLQVPGVVHLVGFRQPTAINAEQMQVLRTGLNGTVHAEPWPYLAIGRHVRIKTGPFRGLDGVLTRKKTGFRVVLSLELIQRSIAVEVDGLDIDDA
jgi:transcription antitermination factor NusG